MFDLEVQLERWRQEAEATLAFEPEELDELEDHLRLRFEAVRQRGMSPEEAWSLALRQLGPARYPLPHRMIWLVCGLTYVVTCLAIGLAAAMALSGLGFIRLTASGFTGSGRPSEQRRWASRRSMTKLLGLKGLFAYKMEGI